MKNNPTPLNRVPAHLWTGPPATLLQTAILYAQRMFCTTVDCNAACQTCSLIAAKKFYGISWLTPERTYTIEQVRRIIQKTALCLDTSEHHLFIMQDAHALNLASANCLLKVLEEPPRGYHFLLLTPYPQSITATIRSRCLLAELSGSDTIPVHPIFNALAPPQLSNPQQFHLLLTKELPLERDITYLIEQLLKQWNTHANNSKKHRAPNQHQKTDLIRHILMTTLAHPPASGSSKLFWKNLYMHLHSITIFKQ